MMEIIGIIVFALLFTIVPYFIGTLKAVDDEEKESNDITLMGPHD